MWTRKILFYLIFAGMVSSSVPLPGLIMQSNSDATIVSPVEGQVLTGLVEIIGTTAIPGFEHYELEFSNSSGLQATWFFISNSSNSANGEILYYWDTTLITDGDYRLRLQVFSEEGSISEFVISKISIRNYTSSLDPSPSPTQVILDPTPAIINLTETPVVRPTDLPMNPLILTPIELTNSLILGILIIFGLIGISFIYTRSKR